MDKKDNKVTISFGYTDEFGNTYSASSSTDIYYDLGETVLGEIGKKLITFLRQMTYHMENDYLLMEDLTEEELWYLEDVLYNYRHGDNSEEENDEYQCEKAE